MKHWAGNFDSSDVARADYNFYRPNARFTNAAGQGPDLAGWKAQGFDQHALAGDPLFTNLAAGDLSLQAGSPAVNAAVGLGPAFLPLFDILGSSRIDAGPDLGAFGRQ